MSDTTVYVLPVPATSTSLATTKITTTQSLDAPSTPVTTTAAPTVIMTAGSPSIAFHWYDARWTEPATWLLLAYCTASIMLLYGLCSGGCLDRKLNLDFSAQTRNARRRERQQRRGLEDRRSRESLHYWADIRPQEYDLREDHIDSALTTQTPNVSATSVVTELGQGDEAELADVQRALAVNGVHVSERYLREQRRAYERSVDAQTRPMTAWPSPPLDDTIGVGTIRYFHSAQHNDSADDISAEYAAELERHRQYRFARIRANELQQNMSREQRRRLQQSAQVEANLRAIGLL